MSLGLALVTALLLGAVSLAVLASLVSTLANAVHWIADHPTQASRDGARLSLLLLFTSLLLISSESLPFLTLLILNILSSTPSILSLPRLSLTLQLLSLLLLVLLSHWTLTSHISQLHGRIHDRRTAPRLPGGRLDWDYHPAEGQEEEEYTVFELITLYAVLCWGQLLLGGLLIAGRIQRQGWTLSS